MIDFSEDTYQALLQKMLAQIPDIYDKRDGSPIPTALGPAAFVLAGFYLSLNQVQKQAFVQTAVGQSIDYLATLAGLTRYPASAAVRLGVFNTAVPVGARFSTINGADSINFVVTAPAEGANQYQLTAETPGSIGNDYSGPILPITNIPGLTSAQITDILVPGDDTETDEELRARLITALNDRPFGGNIASYRTDILAIDGVAPYRYTQPGMAVERSNAPFWERIIFRPRRNWSKMFRRRLTRLHRDRGSAWHRLAQRLR